MPNCIPYLVLIMICLPLFIWIVIRKKKMGLFPVLLTYVGMIYVFGYFIFVLFDSYQYKPHLLQIPYYDNVMGAMIADLVAAPTVALLVAVFYFKLRWILLLALLFGGVEWTFVYVEVYELHWWRIPYTVFVFSLLFLVASKWWKEITTRYRPFMHYLSLFFCAFTLTSTAIFITAIYNVFLYHAGVFSDTYRDSVFVATIVCAIESLVISLVQDFFYKSWFGNGCLVVFSVAFQFVLAKVKLLEILIDPVWCYVLIAACCSLVIFLTVLLNGWLLQLMPSVTGVRRKKRSAN